MPVKFFPLLAIMLLLAAGCITTVQEDRPAETPATASVVVSSTPPGAEVYLDTVYQGTTPVTIVATPGSHNLELRLRDHTSWSKTIQVDPGTKAYVDTQLVPVPVITSLPTTVPTTRTVTLPTTRARPVTETTPAVLETPVGCWEQSFADEGYLVTETFVLQAGGTGWMNGTRTTAILSQSKSFQVWWANVPGSSVVTITEAYPEANTEPQNWVLTWVRGTDVLDGGEMKGEPRIYKRAPCD